MFICRREGSGKPTHLERTSASLGHKAWISPSFAPLQLQYCFHLQRLFNSAMTVALSNPQNIFTTLCGPDIKTTEDLISELWPCRLQVSESGLNAISRYWNNQVVFENTSEHIISSIIELKTVARIINDNPTLKKTELIQRLQSTLPNLKDDDTMVINSLELVARLFLMFNIQPTSSVTVQSLSTSVPWPDTRSLADVLHSWFPQRPCPQTSQVKKHIRILNVYNLEKIGGFSIQWTDNLAEHLMFEDNTIYLFHHVSLLYCMKESVDKYINPLCP